MSLLLFVCPLSFQSSMIVCYLSFLLILLASLCFFYISHSRYRLSCLNCHHSKHHFLPFCISFIALLALSLSLSLSQSLTLSLSFSMYAGVSAYLCLHTWMFGSVLVSFILVSSSTWSLMLLMRSVSWFFLSFFSKPCSNMFQLSLVRHQFFEKPIDQSGISDNLL